MLFLWSAYIFCLFYCLSDAGRAVITNNGYSDVVIAISPEIPVPQDSTNFVTKLEETWRKASDVLYKATQSRSYFANITVLIPSNWNSTQAKYSTWQTYEDADFRIALMNPFYVDLSPFTKQNGLCSEQGDYVHVTPDFVLNTNYAPQGKALVTQWAQFRYGVFEEHGDSDGVYPRFYRNSEHNIIATVCTDSKPIFSAKTASGASCSVDESTQVFENTCIYEFDSHFNPNSSLLSGILEKDSVIHFCDGVKYPHNIESPSKHNALCNCRSAWEVISAREDFADGKNPPQDGISTIPKFNYVQYSESDRYVLLMDVSNFMNSSLAEISSVIKEWILRDIPENDSLAIIHFSENIQTVRNLTQVKESNRKTFLQDVPTTADESVNSDFSHGIEAALKQLDNNGGIIVLITAGCNDTCSVTTDVEDALRTAHASLVTVNLPKINNVGGIRLHLSQLVDATQGASFAHDSRSFAKTRVVKNALDKALSYAAYPRPGINPSNTTLAQMDFNGSVLVFDTSITIDNSTGGNVVFRLDYTDMSDLECVYIGGFTSWCSKYAKRGQMPRSDSDTVVDAYAFTLTMRRLEVGQVWVKVTTIGKAEAKYVFTVTSQYGITAKPMDLKCRLLPGYHLDKDSNQILRLQAELMQGDWPVANAKVFAQIGGMNIEPLQDLELLDNGAGADTKARDGIYSRYVVNLKRLSETDDVYVSVNCYAWNDGKAEVYVDAYNTVALGNFTRVRAAGAAEVYYDEDFKPVKITDFRLVKLEGKNVTFEWTSPGKTLDQYQLDGSYNLSLGYTENAALLINSSVFILNNVTKVAIDNSNAVPGEAQLASVFLADLQEGHTYFLSLTLVNGAQSDKTSQPSNIISIYIAIPDSGLSGGAIFGIVFGVTVLVLLIGGISYVVVTKKDSLATSMNRLLGR